MLFNNFKGIIFDVHRTLVDDSGFPRNRIWRLMQQSGADVDLTEYLALYDQLTKRSFDWPNIKPYITIREIHKTRLIQIYKHFNVKRDIDGDIRYLWQCMGSSNIFPEVFEVLPQLSSRFSIALLSNADTDDPLIQILLKNGFRFDLIVTSEQLKIYKPDPAMFNFAIEEMGLKKNEVLMVGDSPISDISGAKKAGIQIVWINRQKINLGCKYPKPDLELLDLKPLSDLLLN